MISCGAPFWAEVWLGVLMLMVTAIMLLCIVAIVRSEW